MAIIFPPFYYTEPPRDLVLREDLDITTCLTAKMSLPRSSAFWEKSEHLRTDTSHLILSLSLILSILWLPLCTCLLWLSRCLLSLLPSSVLFSVWQLSGPTWPALISVSYGSWRVRPSPLNTD